MNTYRESSRQEVENFADQQQLNIETPENYREAAIALFKLKQKQLSLTPEKLETFLQQPGINVKGICQQADITQQYLNRCRKEGKLPGDKVLAKLLPIIIQYGYPS